MKLEKREISLNEYDSLKDAFYVHKTLLGEYVQTLELCTTKQAEKTVIRLLGETAEDLAYVRALLKESKNEM